MEEKKQKIQQMKLSHLSVFQKTDRGQSTNTLDQLPSIPSLAKNLVTFTVPVEHICTNGHRTVKPQFKLS